MESPPSSPSSYSASCSSYAPSSSSLEEEQEEEEDESPSEDDQRRTKPKQTATPKRRLPQEKRDTTHRSNSSSSSKRRHWRPDSEEEEEEEGGEETEEEEEETEEEEEETEGESRRERRQSHSQQQDHQTHRHQRHHQRPHHHHHHHHHRHHHHHHHHHEHRQQHHHDHQQPRNIYRRHVVRGAHQKRVDAVDIPAPAEWLYHDAYAALRLRWEAQADLQLYADQKRRHKPRFQEFFGKTIVERGLAATIQRVTNSSKVQYIDRKAPRLAVGGDLLPWGTWPTRLRNHDGQNFYAGGGGGGGGDAGGGGGGGRGRGRGGGGGGGGGGGDVLLLRDAVDGPFASCWAGSGGVGCSGGVEGVDSVTEDSIHDQLLLGRSLASPSPPTSSWPSHAPFDCTSASLRSRLPLRQPPLSRQGGGGGDGDGNDDDVAGDDDCSDRGYPDHHQGTVKRLVPDGRGRWVEAREEPSFGAAASGNDDRGATAAGSRSRSRSSPPQETPSAAPAAAPVAPKRLVPGWYGGWVEVEDTLGQTARAGAGGAGAAITDSAGSGPDDDAARSVVETRKTSGRKRQRDERVLGAAGGGDGQEDETGGAAGGGSGEEEGTGGWRWRRRGCDSDVRAGGGEGLSDSGGSDDGGGVGGDWQGWTVSEPAKEAVRRVWGRATRRARDAFEPRHRCDAVATRCCPTAERKRGRGGEEAPAVDAAASCHAAPNAAAAAAAAGVADSDGEVEGAGSVEEIDGADSDNEVGGGDAATKGPTGRNHVDGRASTLADPGGNGAGDNRDEPWPPRAAAAGGTIRHRLDPGLLSCLGRECEGIIDAALHVVLGEQLLRSSSGCADGNPPEAADWEDVLSTMSRCSKRARRACPSELDAEKEVANKAAVWGAGEQSDGAVVVVHERLPGLPLNEAVLTRSYNRLLVYLHEKKSWEA